MINRMKTLKAYQVSLAAGIIIAVAMATAMFALGWAAAISYGSFQPRGIFDIQKPLDMLKLSSEKAYPGDRLSDSSIRVFDNRVVVYIKEPYLARFEDTHSMEPVLGHKSTGLEVVPKSSLEIKPGDIISYESGSSETIVHRVVSTGNDSKGWYAITKGDNNSSNDPEKIRFSQIKRILIGILY